MHLRDVLLVFALCAAAVAQAPLPKAGSVDGAVTNSVTGQPVKKATVSLRSGEGAYVAVTAPEGKFHIADVAPGKYRLRVECPGYQTEDRSSEPVAVTAGEATTAPTARLIPYSVVAGTVKDANGEPIPGIEVALWMRYYDDSRKQVASVGNSKTDDRGEYRIFDVRPATYYVVATTPHGNSNVRNHGDLPARAYPNTFYPGVTGLAEATTVKIAAGAELTQIDFRLRTLPLFHIRGRVVDTGGRPTFANARLNVRPCNLSGTDSPPTAPDGSFDLVEPPGLYCLTVTGQLVGSEQVIVADQDRNDLLIQAHERFEIPVLLQYDGPPPAASDRLQFDILPVDREGPVLSVEKKADGTLTLTGATMAQHQLRSATLPPGYYVKSLRYGSRDVSDGLFQAAPGEPLAITMGSDAGQLTVTVQDGEGKPPANRFVFAVPRDGRRYWMTGADALRAQPAIVGGMAPGEYKIFAFGGYTEGLELVPEFLQLLEGRAALVTIPPNGRVAVQVPLIPGDAIEDAKSKLH